MYKSSSSTLENTESYFYVFFFFFKVSTSYQVDLTQQETNESKFVGN